MFLEFVVDVSKKFTQNSEIVLFDAVNSCMDVVKMNASHEESVPFIAHQRCAKSPPSSVFIRPKKFQIYTAKTSGTKLDQQSKQGSNFNGVCWVESSLLFWLLWLDGCDVNVCVFHNIIKDTIIEE